MSKIAEAVSPMHPDKIADRIAGALVDYCYDKETDTNSIRCAFEVLIGHGYCLVIGETTVPVDGKFVGETVKRISGEDIETCYAEVSQDANLNKAQQDGYVCGDNGIFYGDVHGDAHLQAQTLCMELYKKWPFDGKLVMDLDNKEITVNWARVTGEEIRQFVETMYDPEQGWKVRANTIGDWSGGVNVDTGLTGRKLACDFYGISAPLGGGNMHGKDLSKADVSANIYAHLEALAQGHPVEAVCSIGDTSIDFGGGHVLYDVVVDKAWEYITNLGGFEKFAEWGII